MNAFGCFATTRQATGDPLRHFAYVVERVTGKVVWTCAHRHARRGMRGGHVHALACSGRELQRMQRAEMRAPVKS